MVLSLAPLLANGILTVQAGTVSLSQSAFLRLPPDDQAEALRKCYLHLLKNEGSPAVSLEVRTWATEGAPGRNQKEIHAFLARLETELRRIQTTAANKPEAPAAPPRDAETPRRGSSPAPEIWDRMGPRVRLLLIRNAIANELLAEIADNHDAHVSFLVSQLKTWLREATVASLTSAQALVAAVSRETPDTPLHSFFWNRVFVDEELGKVVNVLMLQDAKAAAGKIDAEARKNLLFHYVSGLLAFLSTPIADLAPMFTHQDRAVPTPHPKWRNAFSAQTKGHLADVLKGSDSSVVLLLKDSERHGKILARAFHRAARDPLTLKPDRITRFVIEVIEKDMAILKEILLFVCAEAKAADADWPFLRSFWLTLEAELQGTWSKEILQRLVLVIMAHDTVTRARRK